MNICKNCEYYEANVKESITNLKERKESNWKIPRVVEITKIYKHGKCSEVIKDCCGIGYGDMDELSCKVMTWDGSSYMSGAYVSEDFGCIKFKEKEDGKN